MTPELKVINKHDPGAFYSIQQPWPNSVFDAKQVRSGVQNFREKADFGGHIFCLIKKKNDQICRFLVK